MTEKMNPEPVELQFGVMDYTHPEFSPDELRKLEVAAIYARIRTERRRENRRALLVSLIRMWPVAVGLLLACFAPQIRSMLLPYRPWGMWIVFPFVALARRPELQFTGTLAHIVPVFMLYAQFPLEGLLARMALKNRVTLKGVARHMFFMHFLTGMELVMVSGTLWRIALR